MADFQDNIESGKRMDQDFSREDWRFRARIISSEYAQKCIDLVNQYDFSQSCKIVLAEIISVNFDSNAMLSRTENLAVRKIQLKIAMNIAVTAFDESDVQNPGLLNVMQAIEDAFGDLISRSFKGKERDAITRIETVGTQNYSGLAGPPTQQEAGRGFKLPWRQ